MHGLLNILQLVHDDPTNFFRQVEQAALLLGQALYRHDKFLSTQWQEKQIHPISNQQFIVVAAYCTERTSVITTAALCWSRTTALPMLVDLSEATFPRIS
jgi:hypothetical protein